MIRPKTTLPEYLSTLNPAELATAKSHLLNIFRVNPWLSRFYADCLQIIASNSSPINNLQTRSAIFSNPDSKGSNPMSLNQNIRSCTHIKVNGVRCGSPALRGEVFCYFHQRMIRGVRTPPKSRLHPIALIENEEGIQASLMEIINALVRNTIDLRRAQLVLRALHIAVRNSPRVHFSVHGMDMIREVPDYPAAPAVQKPPAAKASQHFPSPSAHSGLARSRPPQAARRGQAVARRPQRRPQRRPSPLRMKMKMKIEDENATRRFTMLQL